MFIIDSYCPHCDAHHQITIPVEYMPKKISPVELIRVSARTLSFTEKAQLMTDVCPDCINTTTGKKA